MTAHSDPVALAESNVFYRRPDWYDQVQADSAAIVAREVEQLVGTHAPTARTLLDLGCGTGRDLQALASRFRCTGVDLQPELVRYAQRIRPELDVRVADVRDVRLGWQVDVQTCLGNTLAYFHHHDDLAAVFATFTAHAAPGTLLLIATLTGPVIAPARTHRVDTAGLHAEVTISYLWDERTGLNTMLRQWRLDDGTTQDDRVERRVWSSDELDGRATEAGFSHVDVSSAGTRAYVFT